jgi:hypothetical protein
MSQDAPSTSVLAGQLAYLIEDEPALARATDEELAARLNHNDRFARARERYPLDTDAEIAVRITEIPERITPAMVREARAAIPE